ncbi:MAG: CinA family protein [Oscillospiraceae bacterium]|nr:CinA family protein [Oscillospiraceae bacterium]
MNEFISNMRADIDKTAQNVVQLLKNKKLRVSTAESCTGGLLSGAFTGVAGSSQVFELGICAYANKIKEQFLGVSAETLENSGAVSAQCACEMALGIREAAKADIGISVTGIAGPDGGTFEKPVGTVFFACVYGNKCNVLHIRANSEHGREFIRFEAVRQALILMLNTLI